MASVLRSIGEILLENKEITKEQLEDALRWKRLHPQERLRNILLSRGIINELQLLKAFAQKYNTSFIENDIKMKRPEVLKLVPYQIAKKNVLIPIDIENNRIIIVSSKPGDLSSIQDVKVSSRMDVLVYFSTEAAIDAAIEKYYKNAELFVNSNVEQKQAAKKIPGISDDSAKKLEDIESSVSNTPVVKLVNSLIQEAYLRKASDIHIEPFEEEVLIRMRIDGDLQEVMKVNKQSLNGIISRIKILSGMDIAEKRIPQDGRYEFDNGSDIQCDLRVSTLPTIYGEKCVMRLLNTAGEILLTFEKLGMSQENIEKFNKITSAPNGIILVTGPTGSGKSTTLYSVLNKLNSPKVNLTTVEDPVERQLYGVNQVQVNAKAGLTFASGLRSLLRQDPDVIMVGEIRDYETAEIAIRAAITGHLVLSTLHTNDSIATIDRLIDMGIAPYLVSSSVNAIIAQRLVKRLCPKCKKTKKVTVEEKALIGDKNLVSAYEAVGCNECKGTGYKGRIAIYEIVEISNKIKSMITRRAPSDELKAEATKQGAVFLADNLHQLVKDGVTSIEEYKRIVYTV